MLKAKNLLILAIVCVMVISLADSLLAGSWAPKDKKGILLKRCDKVMNLSKNGYNIPGDKQIPEPVIGDNQGIGPCGAIIGIAEAAPAEGARKRGTLYHIDDLRGRIEAHHK